MIMDPSLALVTGENQDHPQAPNIPIPREPADPGNYDEIEGDIPGIRELITRVSNRRLLFDPEDANHLDRIRISNAWVEVASGLKVGNEVKTADWCKKKWRKLRDYYMRTKPEATKRSGQGRSKPIRWPYYSAIDAVLRSCASQNERTISNLDEDKNESLDEQSRYEEQGTVDLDFTSAISPISETPTTTRRKRKNSEMDSSTEKLVEILKEAEKNEDEEFHFGMTVANRLRKLSPLSNRRAQMKIQEVLFDIEFSPEELPN